MLFTEKELKRIATVELIKELEKDENLVLTNISYGSDITVFCAAEDLEWQGKKIIIGVKHINHGNDLEMLKIARNGKSGKTLLNKYYFVGYNKTKYIYTDDKQLSEKAKEKRKERYGRSQEVFDSSERKYHKFVLKNGDKYYDKYFNVIQSFYKTKLKKGMEITLCVYKGRYGKNEVSINYTYRNKNQLLEKNRYRNVWEKV